MINNPIALRTTPPDNRQTQANDNHADASSAMPVFCSRTGAGRCPVQWPVQTYPRNIAQAAHVLRRTIDDRLGRCRAMIPVATVGEGICSWRTAGVRGWCGEPRKSAKASGSHG